MIKYDSYKDIGVEWIGEIPNNWETFKLKYLFTEKKSTKNPLLSSGSISFGEVIYKDDEKIPVSTKESYQEVLTGEFLVNPLNLNYDLKSLRIGKSEIDVVVSQGYIVLILLGGNNPKYFKYFLRDFDIKHMKSLGQGIRQTISFTHLKDELLVKPSLQEQQQIGKFLDTKTSLIDSLIEKTQKKIELLKEKRTSLINHTVTKGLNPNVEMKDSGVEWIGEIPSSWVIGKLKNNSDLKISSVDKHILEDERKVIVCNYTDVYYNEFITSDLELRKGSCSENEYTNFLLSKGDVIITKDSESPTDIGVPSLVKDDLENVVCGYHLSIIKPHKTKLVGNYLFRQLQTERIRSYFEVNSNGITRFGLGKSSVLETVLILPSYSEQTQIVEYLDEQTEIIDTTITKEQKRIQLLKEYRQSLISEVVTGKVKVTNE